MKKNHNISSLHKELNLQIAKWRARTAAAASESSSELASELGDETSIGMGSEIDQDAASELASELGDELGGEIDQDATSELASESSSEAGPSGIDRVKSQVQNLIKQRAELNSEINKLYNEIKKL